MRNLITRYRLSISTLWLAILISFYTTVFLNSHLWRELYQSQADFPASDKWEFLISASLIIWAIQAIILSLMFWGRSAKVIAILILLTAISANYFSDSYGIFYDVRMVQNIFATNKFEAQELIPGSIALTYLKHFVFLLFLIFFIDIKEKKLIKNVIERVLLIFIFFLIAAFVLATNYKDFSSTLRNHREVRHLVIPTSYLVASSKIISGKAHAAHKEKQVLDAQANIRPDEYRKKFSSFLSSEKRYDPKIGGYPATEEIRHQNCRHCKS